MKLDILSTKIDNKKIKEYQNFGWIKVTNFFSKNELKKIKSIAFTYLKKNYKKYSKDEINFATDKKNFNKINSFHRLSDSKKLKSLGEKISNSDLVKRLLKNKTGELRGMEYFAKPAKIGLKSPPHQDNFYWNVKGGNALTIWVSLNKSKKNNGAIYYFNGSHKNGVRAHKNSYAKGSSQTIKNLKSLKNDNKVVPNLKPGDALIHHSLVIHGSKDNKSKFPRKGLTFQIKDRSAQYDFKKLKIYKKNLSLQVKSREKALRN